MSMEMNIRKEMIMKMITIRKLIQDKEDELIELKCERELIATMLESIGIGKDKLNENEINY